jgi:hypothetical protein
MIDHVPVASKIWCGPQSRVHSVWTLVWMNSHFARSTPQLWKVERAWFSPACPVTRT